MIAASIFLPDTGCSEAVTLGGCQAVMQSDSNENSDLMSTLSHATDVLTHFVLPIYRIHQRRPRQVGSGFVVHNRAKHFLISAAHVFETLKSAELVIYTKPGEVQKLEGDLCLTSSVNDDKADTYDVGVLALPNRLAPPYSAGDKVAVDISSLRSYAGQRHGKSYAVIGYPASKSHLNPVEKELYAGPYGYRNISIPSELYPRLGLNEQDHIALPLDLKKGFDPSRKHRNFPKPQGMSGSPIWLLYEDEPDYENRVFPLVGIATTYDRRRKVMYGTDIRVAISMVGAAT